MLESLLAGLFCLLALSGCTKSTSRPNGNTALAQTPSSESKALEPTSAQDAAVVKPAAGGRVVNLFIWASYVSPKSLKDFTQKTGIRVIESTYASNEELLAKLQAGGAGYDVIVPSDYMVAVLTKLDMLERLDRNKLGNFANLDPQFLGKAFDPDNAVSVPYSWSFAGIAVNTEVYKEPVTSWADLLQNPKASGHVSILDDVRESMAVALKLNGASVNSALASDIDKARATLVEAKKHIKAFNSSPIETIATGDVWMAHMYATEALQAMRNSAGKVSFVIPREGATLAIDSLAIPRGAKHKEEALELINHLLSVEANVDFVTEILAGPVLKATKERLPPALSASTTLFPSAEQFAQFEMLRDLGEVTPLYDRAWSLIKAAH